ncbi:MAG: TIGR03118 family protein [Candidatus Riflebacteria bacterium]|nr:TIGR03118 family protein [Candidatus Riflebacteria bacterium]
MKKLFPVYLLGLLVFFAVGCGMFGGGDDNNVGPGTQGTNASSVVLKANIPVGVLSQNVRSALISTDIQVWMNGVSLDYVSTSGGFMTFQKTVDVNTASFSTLLTKGGGSVPLVIQVGTKAPVTVTVTLDTTTTGVSTKTLSMTVNVTTNLTDGTYAIQITDGVGIVAPSNPITSEKSLGVTGIDYLAWSGNYLPLADAVGVPSASTTIRITFDSIIDNATSDFRILAKSSNGNEVTLIQTDLGAVLSLTQTNVPAGAKPSYSFLTATLLSNSTQGKFFKSGTRYTLTFESASLRLAANPNVHLPSTLLMSRTFTTAVSYSQTNLVANRSGFSAARIDPLFLNGWGIAINPNGIFWISANHASVSTVYKSDGTQTLAPVGIPGPGGPTTGAPSGQVFNSTTDFVIPGTNAPAKFIFVAEDGTISAWNSALTDSTNAKIMTTTSGVYKGVALAAGPSGANFLYCANFSSGTVDIFDKNFTQVFGSPFDYTKSVKPFVDSAIPVGLAPFNIKNINGKLYISYAKQKPSLTDDESGPGNGYIDIFTMDGTLEKRFASQGSLNSPWGMTMAPADFAGFPSALLVGNFGDGKINAFDGNGSFLGPLTNTLGNANVIEGLWAIEFSPVASDAGKLFFTAGPNGENDGLFGYLK